MLCPILTPSDYYPASIGKFRSKCGEGVMFRGGVRIKQSGSDLNEGGNNLAGVKIEHNTVFAASLFNYFSSLQCLCCLSLNLV